MGASPKKGTPKSTPIYYDPKYQDPQIGPPIYRNSHIHIYVYVGRDCCRASMCRWELQLWVRGRNLEVHRNIYGLYNVRFSLQLQALSTNRVSGIWLGGFQCSVSRGGQLQSP